MPMASLRTFPASGFPRQQFCRYATKSGPVVHSPRRAPSLKPGRIAPSNAPKPTLSPFPSPPSLPKKPPPSADQIARYRRLPLMLSGITAIVAGFYATSLYKNVTAGPRQDVPLDVSDRFQQTAEKYDEEVDRMEYWAYMGWLRWWLVGQAKGHVLEASVGTGRNAQWYKLEQCKSITMVDQSSKMVEVAMKKWKELHPNYKDAHFKIQSVIDPIEPPHPEGFDTVVQTMGLCSTPEPVKLLKSLGAMTKEDGRILLLEHGKSYYEWINRVLDSTAPAHADKHGCWWNKDIGQIVEESGLEVVKVRRYHFGTTWWVELKPRKRNAPPPHRGETADGAHSVGDSPPADKKWWMYWR